MRLVRFFTVHNFFWHERWTWKDRMEFRGFSVLAKFARYAGRTFATSRIRTCW